MANVRPALRKLAKNLRFDELEEGLLEEIEDGSLDRDELLSVLTMTCHRADPDLAESLCWLAVTSFAEYRGNEESMAVAQGVAPLLPKSEMIREEMAGLFTALYGDRDDLPGILAVTVNDASVALAAAADQANALIALPPGGFFRERAGREAGQSIGIADGVFHSRFKDGPRDFPLERVPTLVPLPADDFRAMLAFEKERLGAFAEKDPCGLVEACVRALGPRLTYRDLRTHIMDVVPEPWSSWWNDARPLVKRSPWVEMSGTAQPTFDLRKTPLSHEARVQAEFDEAETSLDKLLVVLDYLGEAGEHVANEADLARLLATGVAGLGGEDRAIDLGVAAMVRTLGVAAPGAEDGIEVPDLPEDGDPAIMMATLGDVRLQRSVLELVREKLPETYGEFHLDTLPALVPELAESTARELEEAGWGGEIPEVVSTIIENPGRYPAAFIWLFREVSAGRLLPEDGGPDRPRLLGLVLLAIDRTLRGKDADKKLSVRIRSALTARNFRMAREILENADTEEALTVKEALDRCFSISDDFRAKVHDLLVDIHHELYASNLQVWELTDVIFSTAAGLERERAELDDLVMNVLPHIAEQIGKAAAEGDLSENAEYHGWLEQRDRMSTRANSMQADLKMAKVIQPEMAGELEVSIGSRVTARDQNTGETKDFTFLGPWDVDTENGIYSYRAPLSLSFMGKKPGDVAVFDFDDETKRFEIIKIRSAL